MTLEIVGRTLRMSVTPGAVELLLIAGEGAAAQQLSGLTAASAATQRLQQLSCASWCVSEALLQSADARGRYCPAGGGTGAASTAVQREGLIVGRHSCVVVLSRCALSKHRCWMLPSPAVVCQCCCCCAACKCGTLLPSCQR